jgi:drug/metabolite transporter (DMT)-like permease
MKAFILLLFSGVLTSGVIMVSKLARVEGVAPLAILLWQITGSSILLWSVLLLTRDTVRPIGGYLNRHHMRYYLIGGLLGITLPFTLIYTVVQDLPVGLVGLITALSPLMTYALTRLLEKEAGNLIRLSGILAGLLGVILIMSAKDTGADVEQWPYLLMAMGIPMSLAFSNLYRSIAWPTGSHALPLATGMLSVQGILLLPIAVLSDQFQIPQLNSESVNMVALLLMLMAGLSYFSSFFLLRIAGPVYLSQMGYVITVVTVCLGIIFFDEQYRLEDWMAMALIFVGLLMVSSQSNTSQPTDKVMN